MPSIFEAIIVAETLLHRILITTHNCPANPTIEVIPVDSSVKVCGTVSWQPNISSRLPGRLLRAKRSTLRAACCRRSTHLPFSSLHSQNGDDMLFNLIGCKRLADVPTCA